MLCAKHDEDLINQIYTHAWPMLSDSARTTLYAMGVHHVTDLHFVRDNTAEGEGFSFRGSEITLEQKNAYLEFREKCHEVLRRRSSNPETVVDKVTPIRP